MWNAGSSFSPARRRPLMRVGESAGLGRDDGVGVLLAMRCATLRSPSCWAEFGLEQVVDSRGSAAEG